MMRRVFKNPFTLGLALAGTLTACGDDGTNTPDNAANTGTTSKHVADSVEVPTDANAANRLAFDLDGTGEKNALGNVLALLGAQGIDVQMQIDEAVAEGSLILLHSITSDDAAFSTDSNVRWRVYLGDMPATPPTFNGTDALSIAATSPTDAYVDGSLVGGAFETRDARTLSIQIALVPGAPIQLDLVGAQVAGTVSPTGVVNGRLGGAVTKDDLDNQILPTVADLLNDRIAADAGCAGGADMCIESGNKTILDLFDANDDLTITTEELQTNSLIMTALAPDVDMLQADGVTAGQDGVVDSLSLAIGFTTVNAVYTDPNEATPAQ